ncbi:MAG TPA: OmpH family outer membrane protein [Caldithrix abyssi]|uniref:OmpH family outer membrane protein n=1 Tax=Caldithrix abyssi TaxID=187145 RepID=A0A7V5UFA8_CALAY|nr:OmpH family outer membrane protein [Caldithrix abyssi]
MKLNKMIITLALVTMLAIPAFAQKFAYVQSQRILAEFQEFVDVQNKLNEIRNGYDAQYQKMLKEYNDMLQEIDSQSLLLSPEKKQEKMRQAQEKATEIERFKYEKLGPEGEFYKKSQELTQPIIDKINKLIAKIGEEEGYDFIFDASSGALVHALPKYDITDQVIEQLNKGAASTTTGKGK